MTSLQSLISLSRAPVILAIVGISTLCLSAVSSSTDALPANMAPTFVADTFKITCPGTKDGDCRPNHHCPIQWTCYESRGETNGKGTGTPLYCTDGGQAFVGCDHVFHSITRCVVQVPRD